MLQFFIRNLKAERARAGLTQGQMAEKLGMATFTYLNKENGKKEFKLGEIFEICIILKISPEELLKKPS